MEAGPQKSGLRRVFGATVYYGLAAYIPRLVNFFLLPIFAYYLTPEDIGIVEICTTIQILVQAVSRLGLPGALARHYFDHRDDGDFEDMVTTLAVGLLASSALTTGLAFLALPEILRRFFPEVPFYPFVAISVGVAFLLVGSEIQSRVLQAKEMANVAARITVTVSLVTTCAKVLLVVVFGLDALGVLLADLVGATIAAGIAIVRHRRDLTGRFRPQILKEGLAFGVPLVPHRVGAWLNQFAAQWVLAAVGAVSTVGLLGMATRIVSPIRMGSGAFTTAYPPIYFGWRKDLEQQPALVEIRRVALVVVTVGALASLGASVFGPLVILYALPARWRGAAPAAGVLAAALLIRIAYNLHGVELQYSKRTKPISIIFFAASVVNIATTWWLAPKLGVMGAAWAQLAATSVSVVLTILLSTRSFPSPLSARAVSTYLLAASFSVVAPELLLDVAGGSTVSVAVAVAAFLLCSALILATAGFTPARLKEQLLLLRRSKRRRAP